MKKDEFFLELMRVDKIDENGWKLVKTDESGQNWRGRKCKIVDTSGVKIVKIDEGGWKWMTWDESG